MKGGVPEQPRSAPVRKPAAVSGSSRPWDLSAPGPIGAGFGKCAPGASAGPRGQFLLCRESILECSADAGEGDADYRAYESAGLWQCIGYRSTVAHDTVAIAFGREVAGGL